MKTKEKVSLGGFMDEEDENSNNNPDPFEYMKASKKIAEDF